LTHTVHAFRSLKFAAQQWRSQKSELGDGTPPFPSILFLSLPHPSLFLSLPFASLPLRIQYKLASLAFRALSGLAPDYLAGDCQLVADSGRRSLRSAERRVCTVPRQNSTFSDRSFVAAGPRAWNELPFSLRDTGLLLTLLLMPP